MHTGNLQERVFGGDGLWQLTFEFIARGFTAAKPCLAFDCRVNNVRPADAAREAIKHAAAARMRIAAHQRRARHGVTIICHELVADALLAPHVVQALDAEAFDKLAPGAMRASSNLVRRGHTVIKHHHDTLRVAHALDVAPVARHEIVVEQNDGVQLHRHHIAGHNGYSPTFSGEYFFRDSHPHGVQPPTNLASISSSRFIPIRLLSSSKPAHRSGRSTERFLPITSSL